MDPFALSPALRTRRGRRAAAHARRNLHLAAASGAPNRAANAAQPECGSMAEQVLEQSWVNGSATIDTERPPHGKHDRGLA